MDFSSGAENKYRDFVIQKLKSDGHPVIIYGAGAFGKYAAESVLSNNISLLSFWDKEDYWSPGKTVTVYGRTVTCINKAQLLEVCKPYNLLLGLIDYSLLEGLRLDFPACNHVEYLDAAPKRKMSLLFLQENKDTLQQLYSDLCDKESKDVLEAYLYGRYTGDVSALSALKHDSAYLYDWELLSLSKNDVIADGGAYIGDSIWEIESYLGELPLKIFAFEPDEKNRSQMIQYFSKEQSDHVCVVPAGLYSRNDFLHFSATGTQGASTAVTGESIVPVQALDEYEDYKKISVIKMDIEGDELYALHGCKRLILEKKPRLAICIYHKNADITDIYKFLKQFDYQFYLRQHHASLTETVLYAI